MADPDDNNLPNDTHNDDQLAEKLSRLTADQQTLYRNQVDINSERNGRVSRGYQLKLADSLLKNLPPHELSREIGELNRQEFQFTYWRDQPAAGKPMRENPSPAQNANAPDRNVPEQIQQGEPDHTDPLKGKIPHAPSHDYSALQTTHDQLAATPKIEQRQQTAVKSQEPTASQPAPPLSRESLSQMLEHFPEIRREAKLQISRAEVDERANLAQAQDADRQKLDQAHGTLPNQRQHAERDLLDHQHLAEQVGVQAKYIAQHLKTQNSPDAQSYGADSRRAFQTARQIHEQRQKLGSKLDHSQDPTPKVRDDQGQKQSDAPNARHAAERKDRTDAARETTGGSKDQSTQKGNANPGRSPSGGRGGR